MWNLLEALGQDLKFTLRSLRHNPGFTLLAVVVMAQRSFILGPAGYQPDHRPRRFRSMPKVRECPLKQSLRAETKHPGLN